MQNVFFQTRADFIYLDMNFGVGIVFLLHALSTRINLVCLLHVIGLVYPNGGVGPQKSLFVHSLFESGSEKRMFEHPLFGTGPE